MNETISYTNVAKTSDKILFRGIDADGNRVAYRDDFVPDLFLVTDKPSEYFTLDGSYLSKINPGSMWDCKKFIDKYEYVSGVSIYGNTNYPIQFISRMYLNQTVPSYPDHLRVAYLDIEVQSEKGFPDPEKAIEEINVITIECGGRIYVMGVGDFVLDDTKYTYECFEDEATMLEAFISLWINLDLDVVTGWNCEQFDMVYILNRIDFVLGSGTSKKLSPWGRIKTKTRNYYGKKNSVYEIVGISIIDYLDLYRKYRGKTQESYKLDHIAASELGIKKLKWDDKYDTMQEFYTKNFQLFVEYNIVDVDIVKKLDDKLNFISLQISMAYMAKVNYCDIFSQVRTWDSIIYNHLIERKIVVENKKPISKDAQYAGAYVKDPIVGMYEWVVSFDLASLYPSLIRGYNVSPDTFIERNEMVAFDNMIRNEMRQRISNAKN